MKNYLKLTMIMVFTMSLAVSAQYNLITNYLFDQLQADWELLLLGEGAATWDIDETGKLEGDNSAAISITSAGTATHNIQLNQYYVAYSEDSTYYFSFMASVEEDVTMTVLIIQNVDPRTRYWEEPIVLTPDTKHYKIEVTPDLPGDADAALKIHFGLYESNAGNTVYLDSIVLSTDPFLYGEPVSIEDVETASDFRVYPNPANGNFTIELNAQKEITMDLEIYNICGQKVGTLLKDYTFNNGFKQQFSTENLNPGMYYIKGTGEGKELYRKLIVN